MNTTQKKASSRQQPRIGHRFEVFELSLGVIRSLRLVVTQIGRHDKSLTKQLREAATSVSLNLAEGNRRVGKDRTHFFRIAAGSAEESRACLRVADAWGYINEDAIQTPLESLDSILAILHRLTR